MVPGFSLFRRSSSLVANPTTQGVSLRGLGSSGASRSLVLWDGIPLNSPFGGWIYWTRVSPEQLDRVEVSRGASTSVFGDKAMGGSIGLFTGGLFTGQTLPRSRPAPLDGSATRAATPPRIRSRAAERSRLTRASLSPPAPGPSPRTVTSSSPNPPAAPSIPRPTSASPPPLPAPISSTPTTASSSVPTRSPRNAKTAPLSPATQPASAPSPPTTGAISALRC